MTQSTKTSGRNGAKGPGGVRQNGPLKASRGRTVGRLRFPADTAWALTPFRKKALNDIYRAAAGLAGERLASAGVSLISTPDEEDSFHLDLTLAVDADWDAAHEVAVGILEKVSEWSKEWSEEDRDDYGRWIYFGVIPAEL